MGLLNLFAPPNIGKLKDNGNVEKLVKILTQGRDPGLTNAAKTALVEMKGSSVNHLIAIIAHRDGETRKLIADTLIRIGTPSVDALVATLKDSSWEVRKTAAEILGQIGISQVIPPLIETLSDRHSGVQAAASKSLRRNGDHAIKSLVTAIRDTRFKSRDTVATVLGEIGGKLAIDTLISTFKDRSSNVRNSAIKALHHIGEPAIDPIMETLKEQDKEMRRYAVSALGEFQIKRVVQPLIKALEDAEWSIRWAAVEALAKTGDKRAIKPLTNMLSNDKDEDVRATAASALGQLGDVQEIPTLVQALDKGSVAVRSAAIRGLIAIGTIAIDPLVILLKDTNEYTRKAVTEVLEAIGEEVTTSSLVTHPENEKVTTPESTAGPRKSNTLQAIDLLITALDDPDKNVRLTATQALGRTSELRAIGPLIVKLNDTERSVRTSAATSLVSLGRPAVASLINALDSPEKKQKELIISALGNIRDSRAIKPLMIAIESDEKSLRIAAATAIGQFGILVHEPLINALKSSRVEVREAATIALGEVGDERALRPLLDLLKTQEESVRMASAHALAKIGKSAVDPLISSLREVFWDVRFAAATALGETDDPRAVDPLVSALKDEERAVRDAAAKSLEQLGYDRKTRRS